MAGFQIPDPPGEGCTQADCAAYIQGLARQLAEDTPENAGLTNGQAMRMLELIVISAATAAVSLDGRATRLPSVWIGELAVACAIIEIQEGIFPFDGS